MKTVIIILTWVKNLFIRIFISRIDYKKLYSSPWNKDKSEYLRKKIRGKKSISWTEKRGKRSYFDRQLNHFVNPRLDGFDDEVEDINPKK